MRISILTIVTFWPLLAIAASAQIGDIVVTSAASFQPGMPPPGSIGTIFCTGISVDGVVGSSALPLSTNLAGITVTIGGLPAPLFAAADLGGYQQINFQVPLEVNFNSDGTVSVVVAQGNSQGSANAKSAYYVISAQDYFAVTPGEFFRISGTQYGVFQHSRDFAMVTEANPAVPGETIIAYLTGLPPSNNPPADGQPAPVSPLSVVAQFNTADIISQLSLEIAGTTLYDPPPLNGDSTGLSPISFIGLTPGSVGLYQINFSLPQSVPPGDLQVQLVLTYCPQVQPTIPGFPSGPPQPDCYVVGTTGRTQWYYSQRVILPAR